MSEKVFLKGDLLLGVEALLPHDASQQEVCLFCFLIRCKQQRTLLLFLSAVSQVHQTYITRLSAETGTDALQKNTKSAAVVRERHCRSLPLAETAEEGVASWTLRIPSEMCLISGGVSFVTYLLEEHGRTFRKLMVLN